MPAPGFEPGWLLQDGFGASGHDDPWIAANGLGEIAFLARSRNAGVCDDDLLAPIADSLFVSESDGSLVRVASDGDPAPDRPAGDTLTLRDAIALNDAGELAFAATIDAGPSGPSHPAIYRWTAESGTSLVVQQGLLDGTMLGPLFGSFRFSLGGSGHVAFVAYEIWNDLSPWILVAAPDGPVQRVLGPGDPVPGMAQGDAFSWFDDTDWFRVNAAGEVAFVTSVDTSGSGGIPTRGIWGPDEHGALSLRLREGQEIEVAPGETVGAPALIHLADDGSILASARLGASITPAYLRIDPHGSIELIAGAGRNIDVGGVPVAVPYASLVFDADLERFAIGAASQGIYVSVPEPGSSASALAAIAALVAATCRRRNRSCRRAADRLRSAPQFCASSRERA
jgi:hypothetical protein